MSLRACGHRPLHTDTQVFYAELVRMGSRLAALRDAYDQVSQDRDAADEARARFAELLQVGCD